MAVLLTQYEVSDDIFDKILYDYAADVVTTDSFEQYIYGYPNKRIIYYDGHEYMICREYVLNYYTNQIVDCTSWKQIRLRKTFNMKPNSINPTVSGTYAYNYMMKVLRKSYSDEEIVAIFNEHQADYDKAKIQYHYNYYVSDINKIYEIQNCKKYDINGAHCDALLELFPKAEADILRLYNARHEHPYYKQIINYFVGYLTKKGFRNTYNWIVQRTTNRLIQAMDATGGELIYANTDGYIVHSPDDLILTSKKLGDFKEEYSGTIYYYQTNNYYLIQYGDDMVGSCLTAVRNRIDLRENRVVSYKRTLKNNVTTIENLKEIVLDENSKKTIL